MLRVVRRMVRDQYKRLPANRQLKGLGGIDGRSRLVARTLLAPLVPFTVTLTDGNGVRYLVTRDRVDARIVDDLTGRRRPMWFPNDAPTESEVELILDVGGHHGHYLAAAARFWPRAELVSVEPSHHAADLIRSHTKLNNFAGRVEIVTAAIAAQPGIGTLHHDPDGSWGASLHPLGGESTESVRLVSLTEVLKGRRPDVVKCNAEGGEFALIPQLLELDLRPKLMVVMVHPEFGDMGALIQQLRDANFSIESVGTEHRPAIHARPLG